MTRKFGVNLLIAVFLIAPSFTQAAQCLVNGKWYPYTSSMCATGDQDNAHSSRRSEIRHPTVNSSSQNPVCQISVKKAATDIKKKNEKRYPDSYSLQKTLLTAGLSSYAYLCKQPATAVNVRILSKYLKRYYPSFSLIQTLFDANKKAYHDLNR